MKQGYYYISAVDKGGIIYYYHSDNKFRWYFADISSYTFFKTWKRKGYAMAQFNKIYCPSSLENISLMYCEYGKKIKENSILIEKK